MSTSKEILDYVKNHPSGKVKLAVADIDGIFKG
jgi:glutamine synthetase